MLWPDDLGGSAGLENCPDSVSADMALCVVESRGEEDTVEKQPDGPVVSTRVRTRALLSDSAMLNGMSSVASMSRSMIGWEHRTSREEKSMSPMKGTSPPSAATPAPRERRHEAATKSDTAPGSASPVDKYPTRASAILRRRSDDSIDEFSNLALHVFGRLPTCPLPNLAELTSERRRTHTKGVPKWDTSQPMHRSETGPEAGSCGLSHRLPNGRS